MSQHSSFYSKILDEQYCCMHGYIGLCKARGETAAGMAENLNVPKRTVEHHRTLFDRGRHICQERHDCLKNVIAIIKEKGP